MQVLFKCWDSKMASREKLFKAATDFATKLGPDRLINITHSEDRDNIVITIWYWGEQEEKEEKVSKKDTVKMRAIPTPPPPSKAKQDVTVTQKATAGADNLPLPGKEDDLGRTIPLEKAPDLHTEKPFPNFDLDEENW